MTTSTQSDSPTSQHYHSIICDTNSQQRVTTQKQKIGFLRSYLPASGVVTGDCPCHEPPPYSNDSCRYNSGELRTRIWPRMAERARMRLEACAHISVAGEGGVRPLFDCPIDLVRTPEVFPILIPPSPFFRPLLVVRIVLQPLLRTLGNDIVYQPLQRSHLTG